MASAAMAWHPGAAPCPARRTPLAPARRRSAPAMAASRRGPASPPPGALPSPRPGGARPRRGPAFPARGARPRPWQRPSAARPRPCPARSPPRAPAALGPGEARPSPPAALGPAGRPWRGGLLPRRGALHGTAPCPARRARPPVPGAASAALAQPRPPAWPRRCVRSPGVARARTVPPASSPHPRLAAMAARSRPPWCAPSLRSAAPARRGFGSRGRGAPA
eukprot:XP_020397782.1 uncharacterized protein LOC103633934 [Zea mays]